ncbi:MAG: ABC-2 family transporter protein [Bdellovibrionales bacterium]|nr:ABC-2 family transporter protein [Bdellovibrionales bacterium]
MLGCARLAILQQLEYRFNLIADTVIQPVIVGLVELTLWAAFFHSTGNQTLNGFSREYYLSYAVWAAFVSRISTSWMYESMMIEDIENGTVNSILVRPISFYEYYLGQFFGYKVFTTLLSLGAPVAVCLFADLPLVISRLPLTLGLVFFYLLLVHTMSVAIASLGFFFSRIHHITVAKNITLWMLTGELFPLDLAPEPFRSILIALPFSSAVYRPVGYLTGRLELNTITEGFLSISLGLLVATVVATALWNAGRRRYSGTGA